MCWQGRTGKRLAWIMSSHFTKSKLNRNWMCFITKHWQRQANLKCSANTLCKLHIAWRRYTKPVQIPRQEAPNSLPANTSTEKSYVACIMILKDVMRKIMFDMQSKEVHSWLYNLVWATLFCVCVGTRVHQGQDNLWSFIHVEKKSEVNGKH